MNQVLQVGRNCWNIAPADETGLLIDGCDYYRAFYQAAGKAAQAEPPAVDAAPSPS
jgi:hypothetical protein